MTLKLLFPPVLFMLFMAFSCADDGRPTEPVTKLEADDNNLNFDGNFHHCDSVHIATYPGTACCISGLTVVKPGSIVRYHYQLNHTEDAQWSWTVVGDIEVIGGQDSHSLTVQFGPNFTTGRISGWGSGGDSGGIAECSEYIDVTID